MTYNNFPRGSEWRKWDLQIQPIENSWLARTEEKRVIERIEESTKEYLKKAKEKNIDVIAITDHNSGHAIDIAINNSNSIVSVLAGVEIDTTEGWHLIIIFNPNYKERLKLSSWKEVIDSFLQKTGDIEKPFFNVKSVGKKIGVNTKELLQKIWRQKIGIPIFAHCCSPDGFFQNSDATGRQEIINLFISGKARFIFEIKDNFDQKNEINNKLRGWYQRDINIPIISSSDAHKASDVGSTFSWIKADPKYNGLLQIIYEPIERLRLQEYKPEAKKPYFIIDNVSFLDGRNTEEFSANPIALNQNLTSIIGGKSTGKSLLLYHIAKTIDPEQVNQKIEELESAGLSLDYDFEKNPDFDFKVQWKDEGIIHLQEDNEQRNRQITYIPQHYLTSLSKRRNLEEKRSLNDFIKDTLLSDPDSKKQEEKTREISTEKLKSISSLINDFFSYFADIKEQKKNLKEKGDKKGIKKYIDELKKDIEELKKQSELNDKEKEKLDKLSSEETDLQKTSSSLTSDIETINSFVKKAKLAVQKLESLKNEYGNYLDSDFSTEQFKKHFAFIDEIKKQIIEADNKLTDKETGILTTKKADIANSLEQVEEKLKPLLTSVKQQESLKEKTKQLKEEEEKINQIEILEKLIQEKEKTLDSTFESIISEYEDIFKSYKSYQEALLRAKEELKDIKINVRLTFDEERFSQQVRDNIQKVELRKAFENYRNDDGEFLYDYESFDIHKNFLKKLLKGLIDEQFKLYKSQGPKETFIAILEDYFYLDFSVTYKNDSLGKMSPGKRNLVLLKIIIEKNNQEWPILIDQPEDDLDNRSVYNDLVSFLKEKKKQRQIIIVTHNPNAVVGADAEEVIVANQTGQDTDRTNEKYDFEYVTGALEHSFKKQEDVSYILQSMGIREHVCDILEGGEDAFRKREEKYGF